jgi:hypothetical protein
MTRSPIAALVVLLAACASGGAGGDTRSAPAASNTADAAARATVRIENGTTDQLRISGRGATSLRLQAGQTGCLRLSRTSGRMVLEAEPLGGGEQRTVPAADSSGTDVIRSQEFSPTEATAWEWKIGRGALNGNQLQPAAAPCG